MSGEISRRRLIIGASAVGVAGLAKVNKVAYYAGRKQFANWYDWQIGSAKPLADCMVLLDEHLPEQDRARYAKAIEWFVPDPYYLTVAGRDPEPSTGANRVDLCQAALVQGIATRSAERIKHAAAG